MSSVREPRFPTDKHDHARCVSNAMHEAEVRCRVRDARLTELRRRVLEIIWRSHRPLGAYSILETLGAERRSSAPPTVYRALEFLLEHGLVHRIASLNAYIGCEHPGHTATSQFLICKCCCAAVELNERRVSRAITASARALGFTDTDHTVEIVGVCPNCQPARNTWT